MQFAPRYKRACFDLGNVIVHVDFAEFYKFLVEQDIVQDYNKAHEFLCGIQHPQDLGLYNIRQGFYRFYPHISKHVLHELHTIWESVVEPSDAMLGLLDDLLVQGYEISLLSNIGFDHSTVLRSRCKVFEKCHQHFSCEVGARKPTKLFYQSFYLEKGWSGVTFFDDIEENIVGAQSYLEGVVFSLKNFDSDEEAANFVRNHLEKE